MNDKVTAPTILKRRPTDGNEFPFDHFLSQKKDNDFKDLGIEKKSLKEFKFDNADSKQASKSDEVVQTTENTFSKEELSIINIEILKILEENINPQKYNAFFQSTFNLENILMDSVAFSVTTPLIKTMVENHYLNQIKETVKSILGKEYEILLS